MNDHEQIHKILLSEVEKLSKTMPKERVSLEDIIFKGKYHIRAGDDLEIHFEPQDVEELKRYVPRYMWRHFKLPIIVVRNPDYGPGIFEVYGSTLEKLVISKILGDVKLDKDGRLIIKTHHVEKLLKKFKSLISIALVFRV